jgi:hypothetical protein
MEKESGDALGLTVDSLAKRALTELLEVATQRARIQLEKEKRDAHLLQRVIVTAAVMTALMHFWF